MIKNGKIVLFENEIIVDKTLPKHKVVKTNQNASGVSFNSDNSFEFNDFSSINTLSNNRTSAFDENIEYMEYLYQHSPTLRLRFKIWLYKKLFSRSLEIEKQKIFKLEDLVEFFESLKTNVKKQNKKDIEDVLLKYTTVLQNAQDNNQIALVEKIKDHVNILKYEMTLCMSKFGKYLTSEDVVKFHNVASVHEKYRTGLCLTYIKNFIKIIPEEITKLKKEADELKVFDNYVILHYDYSGNSVSDTKEEKAKKKDPILFGVIKGSTNLYYVGDWIDDYCDLTLDVIIKKLGKEVGEISVENIKNNIEKI